MSGSLGGGGPAFDPTIPLRAGQGVPQVNPLKQVGEFAETANALNRLQLFPGQLQMQKQQLESNKTALMQQNRQAVFSALVPLLASPDPVTYDKVLSRIATLEAHGFNTQPALAEWGKIMTSGGDFNTQARAAIAANSQTDPRSAFDIMAPDTRLVDTGSGVQPVNVSRPSHPAGAGRVTIQGAEIPVNPSASDLLTPVTYPDTQGRTQTTTKGQFNAQLGNQGATGPAGRRMNLGGADPNQKYVGQPNPLLGGIPNPAPDAPVTATPAPAAPPPPMSISGPAPGYTEAQRTTAEAGANMGNNLVVRADQVPTNKANYANMLFDLRKLDTMGPGTDKEVALNAFLQKLTGYGVTMTKEQVAGGESFAKIANMIAANQLSAIGPSDARQSLAMGANPGLNLSKLGNEEILHMLQGNEDAIAAKRDEWQKWKKNHGADTYAEFSTEFNKRFDPRVFQSQYMSPGEVAKLRKSLTGPGEAKKFQEDYMYARQQGWIR